MLCCCFLPILYLVNFIFSNMFLSLIGICCVLYFLFYLFSVVWFDCDVTLGFAEKFGKKISSLKGKVVFITGASSGIGEHTAIALAKNGVKLVLTARRKQELDRVKTICLAAAGTKLSNDDILVQALDVTDTSASIRAWDKAVTKMGRIDVLFCNAGRSQRANWELIDPSIDQDMFQLNVFAVVRLSRHAVKYFQDNDIKGHIAVTSSVVGVMPLPFSGTYVGTKHALHGYFNCLRAEKFANNISVTMLCPGPTFTNYLQHCYTENVGQNYGRKVQPTDKRMTGERCGYLCAVAIANKLEESWMGVFPMIPILYLSVYSPFTFKILLKLVGPKKLHKIRDSNDELLLPAEK